MLEEYTEPIGDDELYAADLGDIDDGAEQHVSLEKIKDLVEEKRLVFGQYMRRERKRRKLTMKDFSALLGVTEGYAGLLERGERNPSFETLLSISYIFNAEPNDLLLSDRTVSKVADSDAFDAAVSLLRGFSEAHLADVCKILKALHRMYVADQE